MKKAAGILFTDGKKILMLKRSANSSEAGTWSLPGGGVKGHETEIQNAIRETKEETGLTRIPGERIGIHQFRDSTVHFTTFLYRIDKPFVAKMSKEHSAYEWIPITQLASKKLHPKFKMSLNEYVGLIRKKVRDFKEWYVLTTIIEALTQTPQNKHQNPTTR